MRTCFIYKWRYLFLSAGLLIFTNACGDLERSNPLDPENKNAIADQISVAEIFVHRYTRGDSINRYIAFAQQALYDLKETFGQRMVILEYHMNLSDTTKKDSLVIPQNELRYQNEYNPGVKPRAFPHAFFNGKYIDIQGASSFEVARQRYQIILDSLTIKKTKLYADTRLKEEGTEFTINVSLARYGKETIQGLLVEYILIEDIGHLGRYTVRAILPAESVDQIPGGEIYRLPEKTAPKSIVSRPDKTRAVILVKNQSTRRILQACVASR